MRHVQLPVATFAIGARALPLRHGTLQIVERDAGSIDWEVVLHTIELEPIARAVHRVALEVISGMHIDGSLVVTPFTGPAILVRTHENSIVLRGDGILEGFDPELLR